MTVEHEPADDLRIGKGDADHHLAPLGKPHRVQQAVEGLGHAVDGHHLEVDLVDVEGMHVVAVVADHPFLDGAQGHAHVHPAVVEGLAVDGVDLLSRPLGEGQGAGGGDRRSPEVGRHHRTGRSGRRRGRRRRRGAGDMDHGQFPAGAQVPAGAGQGGAGQQGIVPGGGGFHHRLDPHGRADVELVHGQVLPGDGTVQGDDAEPEALDRQVVIVIGALVGDAPELPAAGGHGDLGMGRAVDRLDDPVQPLEVRVGLRRVRPHRRGGGGKALQHHEALLQVPHLRHAGLQPLDDDRSGEAAADQLLHIAVDMGVVPVEARRLGPGHVHHIVEALPR